MEVRVSRGRGCSPLSGWWWWSAVVAARGAVRASAGSRRVVMLIFGGWVPQDLILRGGCQGVGVVGHCLVGVWSNVVAARGAVRASAGSRRVVMLIFGGWVPQDLCSSHVRCLKSSAAPGWALLRRQIAELLCASRGCSGRLASRNGNVDSG